MVQQFACCVVDCCVAKCYFCPSFLKPFNIRLEHGAENGVCWLLQLQRCSAMVACAILCVAVVVWKMVSVAILTAVAMVLLADCCVCSSISH